LIKAEVSFGPSLGDFVIPTQFTVDILLLEYPDTLAFPLTHSQGGLTLNRAGLYSGTISTFPLSFGARYVLFHISLNFKFQRPPPSTSRLSLGLVRLSLTPNVPHITNENGSSTEFIWAMSEFSSTVYLEAEPTSLQVLTHNNINQFTNQYQSNHPDPIPSPSPLTSSTPPSPAILTTYAVPDNVPFIGNTYIPLVSNYTPSQQLPTHLRWSLELPWSVEFGGTIEKPSLIDELWIQPLGSQYLVFNSTQQPAWEMKPVSDVCFLNGINVPVSVGIATRKFTSGTMLNDLFSEGYLFLFHLAPFWIEFYTLHSKFTRISTLSLSCNENLLFFQPMLKNNHLFPLDNGLEISFGGFFQDSSLHLISLYPKETPPTPAKFHPMSVPLKFINALPSSQATFDNFSFTLPASVIYANQNLQHFSSWPSSTLSIQASISIPLNFTVFSSFSDNLQTADLYTPQLVVSVGSELDLRSDWPIDIVFECILTGQLYQFSALSKTSTSSFPIDIPDIPSVLNSIINADGFVESPTATRTSLLFIVHISFHAALQNLAIVGSTISSNQVKLLFPGPHHSDPSHAFSITQYFPIEEFFCESLIQSNFRRTKKYDFSFTPGPLDPKGILPADFRFLANNYAISNVDMAVKSTTIPHYSLALTDVNLGQNITHVELFITSPWFIYHTPLQSAGSHELLDELTYTMVCNVKCAPTNLKVQPNHITFDVQIVKNKHSETVINSIEFKLNSFLYKSDTTDKPIVVSAKVLVQYPSQEDLKSPNVEAVLTKTVSNLGVIFSWGANPNEIPSAYGSLPRSPHLTALVILICLVVIFFTTGIAMLCLPCLNANQSKEDVFQLAVQHVSKSLHLYKPPEYTDLSELPSYDGDNPHESSSFVEAETPMSYEALINKDALGQSQPVGDFLNHKTDNN
jgi:hypothetical protein